MNIDSAFQVSRWEILETLAYRDASATEIAKRAKLSLPNVSQQARMLEAAGLLKVKKSTVSSVGKPRMVYQLNSDIAKITVLRSGFAGQRAFTPNFIERALLSILLWEQAEDHYFLMKFITDNAKALKESLGAAIVNASSGELHFLVLARSEDVENVRLQITNSQQVSPLTGKKKSIINWVHSPEEVQDGIGKGNGYYQKLITKLYPIIEEGKLFKELVSR